jgi:hypothetical protein
MPVYIETVQQKSTYKRLAMIECARDSDMARYKLYWRAM